MTYAYIERELAAGRQIILDGGTGTELERRGVAMNDGAWCGAATVDALATLQAVHRDYIDAGAQVITANTFASSRIMLARAGLADRVEEINAAAVQAAVQARDERETPTPVAVAGSLSHMAPMQAGAASPEMGVMPTRDDFRAAVEEMADIHVRYGADLIILEMMYDPDRMEPAFAAARASGLPFWAGFAARQGANGEVLAFRSDIDVPLADIVGLAREYGAAAAGVMHTPSNLIEEADAIVAANFGGPRVAYPDSGHFQMPSWQFQDIISPQDFAAFATQWTARGVQIIGGCCGLSPEHIAALAPLRHA
ncbi:MAG: homocysteine S-methyltransferase family protein [Pseudomonadota bacterium]